MSEIETSKLIIYLQEVLEEQKCQVRELQRQAKEQREFAMKEQQGRRTLWKTGRASTTAEIPKKNTRLQGVGNQYSLLRTAGTVPQAPVWFQEPKGYRHSKDEETSHEEDKDDFDGTSESVVSAPSETSSVPEPVRGKRMGR